MAKSSKLKGYLILFGWNVYMLYILLVPTEAFDSDNFFGWPSITSDHSLFLPSIYLVVPFWAGINWVLFQVYKNKFSNKEMKKGAKVKS